jgi:hypothetical protein
MMPCLVLALVSSLSAKELLDRSIAYHDPQGRWGGGAFEITDVSARPDGTGRRTILRFDNARSRFEMESTVDKLPLNVVVENDTVRVRLDGRTDLSPAELERHRLTPAQLLTRRNFYLYLYGLPMKLRDPGTRLDPQVKETDFHGRTVYQLRVTYDKSVGSDTWYFYLDRETFALVGHRFHHDESSGDGEHTVLTEEVSGQGLRLPRVRKWFRNKNNELFITHTILSIAAP